MNCSTVCLLLALCVAGCFSDRCYPENYQVTKEISYNHPKYGGLQSSIDLFYDALNEREARYISFHNSSFHNELRFIHVRTNDRHYFVDKKHGWCHSWKAAPFKTMCLLGEDRKVGKDFYIGTRTHMYKASAFVFKTKTSTGYFEANTEIKDTFYPIKFMMYDSKMNLVGNIDFNNGVNVILDHSVFDKPKMCTHSNIKETFGPPETFLDLEKFFEF